jgi:hypothetical protein
MGSPLWLLCGILVGREGFAPELLEAGAEKVHALWIDFVDVASADCPIRDESSLLEHPQVLRDRGPADGEPLREFAHRLGTTRQVLKNLASSCISKGNPNVNFVSHY